MDERLVSGDLHEEEHDASLRPKRLEDFVGQSNTKENLSISIQAASNPIGPKKSIMSLLWSPEITVTISPF